MLIKSKIAAISLLALLLIISAGFALSGCNGEPERAAEAEGGPFDHPDGVYLGESDLED